MKEFKPVKQNRISVKVVNQLKGAILSGRFKAGGRMPSERELTEQFQVSRVVVREAIRELEITGFVKILQGPTGGAYVTDLSFDHLSSAFLDLFLANKLSVAELIHTRILIECEIAGLAATHAQPEFLSRLEQALKAEESASPSQPKLISNRLMVHYLLAEMSGNRILQGIASALYHLTREVLLVVKPVKTVIHRHEEHVALVRAVCSRSPKTAAAAMKRHLESLGKELVNLEGVYRERKGLVW